MNDIVRDGYNGYLFEFNQIDQIADKIIQLNDDITYNQLQINCLNTIDETFSHKYLSIKIKIFTMKQNNVKFRKVKKKLCEIFNLFKKVFTLNISRKYYDERCLIRKNYNSFIAVGRIRL